MPLFVTVEALQERPVSRYPFGQVKKVRYSAHGAGAEAASSKKDANLPSVKTSRTPQGRGGCIGKRA